MTDQNEYKNVTPWKLFGSVWNYPPPINTQDFTFTANFTAEDVREWEQLNYFDDIEPETGENMNEETKRLEPGVTLKEALGCLTEAFKSDPIYAFDWHDDIAMAYVDAGGNQVVANKAASHFMKQAFGVVTIWRAETQPKKNENDKDRTLFEAIKRVAMVDGHDESTASRIAVDFFALSNSYRANPSYTFGSQQEEKEKSKERYAPKPGPMTVSRPCCHRWGSPALEHHVGCSARLSFYGGDPKWGVGKEGETRTREDGQVFSWGITWTPVYAVTPSETRAPRGTPREAAVLKDEQESKPIKFREFT